MNCTKRRAEVDVGPRKARFGDSRIGLDLDFCNPLKSPKPPISWEPWSFERQIVPAKEIKLSDIERTPRIRETACEIGRDNDPASFGRAFEQVIRASEPKKNSVEK